MDSIAPGSLPFFRIGTHDIPSSEAIKKLNRKPRESNPTTTSISGQHRRTWDKIKSFRQIQTSPFVSAVKISLKIKSMNNL